MSRPECLLADDDTSSVLVRAADPVLSDLLRHLFSRYPSAEGVTLAQFGWRATASELVLTLRALDLPHAGEVDLSVKHVVLGEPYLLRAALSSEEHSFAVGVIHSHPQGAGTMPSWIDDDMDRYLASYFGDFALGRPYPSLIAARDDTGRLAMSGRVKWQGRWSSVTRVSLRGQPGVGPDYGPLLLPRGQEERVARLASAFGREAAALLHHAVVGVVGASGTGSPALEVLARSGVGRIIVVDPDLFEASNLERIHGSEARDLSVPTFKVDLQRRHLLAINPALQLVSIRGRLPQRDVLDALVQADVVLGCTDSHCARVALSDLSQRYLVPVLDAGVSLEGRGGRVTGQVLQLTRMLPGDCCVYCRGMVDPVRVTEELMTSEEQAQRLDAAKLATSRGESGAPYWRGMPQLNAVGYLTTATGALAAGYAIGWLTGRFEPPFEILQADLTQPEWAIADRPTLLTRPCECRNLYGVADQGVDYALISPPEHWPEPEVTVAGQ